MIKARVYELDGDDVDAEELFHGAVGGSIGALAMAHPELATIAVPNAVAGTLQHQSRRQFVHAVDHAARLERAKSLRERRLLALAFRMTEPRQQGFSIKHHG